MFIGVKGFRVLPEPNPKPKGALHRILRRKPLPYATHADVGRIASACCPSGLFGFRLPRHV